LHDPVDARPGGLEHRAQVREHLLRLLGDASRHELRRTGPQPDLPGDEDEPVRLDRLRVRRALERRRRGLGADDLPAHSSPPYGRRHAWPSAAPRALKIAARTCSGSRPSSTRIWTFSVAAAASSFRNRETTSLARPPTACPEKSTF